jgi:hypothetical protein
MSMKWKRLNGTNETDLRWNNLMANGAAALRDGLAVNASLTSLLLSGNQIPLDIARAIGMLHSTNLSHVIVLIHYCD